MKIEKALKNYKCGTRLGVGMSRKQFQELAAMLREHRRVVNISDLSDTEKHISYIMIDNIEVSLIGICKRNNPNFDTDRFLEAARFTEATQC